jgi:SRP-independent targeting protein 2/TMEM208
LTVLETAASFTMAQKAAKSLAVRNTSRLKQTHLISLCIHAVFLLLAFTLRRSLSLRRYFLLSAPSLIIEFYLDRLSRPSYNTDGSLRSAGDDLDAKGLTEFMWDILYWTWINLMAVIVFGNRAWWLYLAVPGYAIYAAISTATGLKGMLGSMAGAGSEGEVQSNRQKKMEQRGGQTVKYQR